MGTPWELSTNSEEREDESRVARTAPFKRADSRMMQSTSGIYSKNREESCRMAGWLSLPGAGFQNGPEFTAAQPVPMGTAWKTYSRQTIVRNYLKILNFSFIPTSTRKQTSWAVPRLRCYSFKGAWSYFSAERGLLVSSVQPISSQCYKKELCFHQQRRALFPGLVKQHAKKLM